MGNNPPRLGGLEVNDAQDDRLELNVATRHRDACHVRVLAPIWLADNSGRKGIVEGREAESGREKGPTRQGAVG